MVQNAYHAAWSPDGTRLAVVEATSRTLRVLTANGRLLRKLGFNAVSASWQPTCTRSGGPGADRLSGTSSNELICGLGGDGNDSIEARGGGFDVVGCGRGIDTALVDLLDHVGVDCER